MTPKEQKIKEEWIAIYGEEKYNLIKYAIKENGYIDCVRNPEISEIINTTQKGIYWGTTNYYPLNIKGIANNNGWIKIESEADLPKTDKTIQLWFMTKNGLITTNNWSSRFKHKISGYLMVYSHYQPIQKPEPPIY